MKLWEVFSFVRYVIKADVGIPYGNQIYKVKKPYVEIELKVTKCSIHSRSKNKKAYKEWIWTQTREVENPFL